jgi:hypothetical protein
MLWRVKNWMKAMNQLADYHLQFSNPMFVKPHSSWTKQKTVVISSGAQELSFSGIHNGYTHERKSSLY